MAIAAGAILQNGRRRLDAQRRPAIPKLYPKLLTRPALTVSQGSAALGSYCFAVVVLNAPGVVLPKREFPWKESIVPPFRDSPVVF